MVPRIHLWLQERGNLFLSYIGLLNHRFSGMDANPDKKYRQEVKEGEVRDLGGNRKGVAFWTEKGEIRHSGSTQALKGPAETPDQKVGGESPHFLCLSRAG